NRRRDCLQPFLLALIAVLAVLAEDQQAEVVMRAVAEQREGANRNLDTLKPLEPAHKEQQSTGAVSDFAASLGSIDRLEHREVDARRDDEDSSRVGAVRLDQVGALVVRRRDQEVRLLRDLALHPDAKLRLGTSPLGKRPVFDQ